MTIAECHCKNDRFTMVYDKIYCKEKSELLFVFSLDDLFNTINHILIDLQSPLAKMGVAKVQVIHFD